MIHTQLVTKLLVYIFLRFVFSASVKASKFTIEHFLSITGRFSGKQNYKKLHRIDKTQVEITKYLEDDKKTYFVH